MCTIWIQRPKLKRSTFFESHRIMHQIQINVAQAKFLATATSGRFNLFRLMIRVPQFGNNENVFTFHNTFIDLLLDGFSNFCLVLVQSGGVKVTITNINCIRSSSTCFTKGLKSKKKKFDNEFFSLDFICLIIIKL